MQEFRIYLCDQDNRVRHRVDHEAASDDDAIAYALTIEHPHAIEVWQAARRVRSIAAGEPSPGHGGT